MGTITMNNIFANSTDTCEYFLFLPCFLTFNRYISLPFFENFLIPDGALYLSGTTWEAEGAVLLDNISGQAFCT